LASVIRGQSASVNPDGLPAYSLQARMQYLGVDQLVSHELALLCVRCPVAATDHPANLVVVDLLPETRVFRVEDPDSVLVLHHLLVLVDCIQGLNNDLIGHVTVSIRGSQAISRPMSRAIDVALCGARACPPDLSRRRRMWEAAAPHGTKL